MSPTHCLSFLLLASLAAAPAAAQSVSDANPWSRGTELGVVVGGATSSSTTGPMAGMMIGWETTRWFAIEGRGTWFDRGSGAQGFGADLGAVVNLIAKRDVTPFVSAGFGLYLAMFDAGASSIPAFYRDRLTDAELSHSTSFTDPAFRVSAGVDVIAHRRFTMRPEASVVFVRSDGHGDTLFTFGVRLGMRFEDHPITPARTR